MYLSWGTLVRKLGLATPPAMLKMDIEGFEWAVLESIVRSGSGLLPFRLGLGFGLGLGLGLGLG